MPRWSLKVVTSSTHRSVCTACRDPRGRAYSAQCTAQYQLPPLSRSRRGTTSRPKTWLRPFLRSPGRAAFQTLRHRPLLNIFFLCLFLYSCSFFLLLFHQFPFPNFLRGLAPGGLRIRRQWTALPFFCYSFLRGRGSFPLLSLGLRFRGISQRWDSSLFWLSIPLCNKHLWVLRRLSKISAASLSLVLMVVGVFRHIPSWITSRAKPSFSIFSLCYFRSWRMSFNPPSSERVWISSMSSNRFPLSTIFNFGNIQKS